MYEFVDHTSRREGGSEVRLPDDIQDRFRTDEPLHWLQLDDPDGAWIVATSDELTDLIALEA